MKLEANNLGAKATTIPFGPSFMTFFICIPNVFFKFEIGIHFVVGVNLTISNVDLFLWLAFVKYMLYLL
jgi:hypothetical protein